MNHSGRIDRAAKWFAQPGRVESLLALFILGVVIYIYIRYKIG